MPPSHAGLAVVLLLAASVPLAGQTADWRAQVPPAAVPEIERLVDRARRDGLPAEPLVAKALEGAGYGAPSRRIVAAVAGLERRLRDAGSALGPGAVEAELTAGADALAAGVPGPVLRDLRRARPGLPVTVPLVVLTDLVVRGVPREAAARAVVRLAGTVRDDPRLLDLGRRIEGDIAAGASPARALAAQLDRMAATLPPLGPPPMNSLGEP